MPFTESNTVEAFIRNRLITGGWTSVAPRDLQRQVHEVMVEEDLRDALIRLNPDIEAEPDRADDVLYRLRAILLGVRTDGLVKANEEFAAWLTGERSMPFGPRGEHVTIHLIDLINPSRNKWQYRKAGRSCPPRQRHAFGIDRGKDSGPVQRKLARWGSAGSR
jgi:type I site-specific restriction-modification system R (restriction) subunit